MIDFDYYENLIKEHLSEKRYVHSINVSRAAVELSRLYGGDEDKARLAGILHDITKETPLSEQYALIEKNGEALSFLELHNSAVIHQKSGAAYCALELKVDDAEVLSAIRYHTTGRRDMTVLEKIVYTADLISAERDYPDVEIMRKLAAQSLDEAMLYAIKYTVNNLVSKTELLHPDTVECYNSILESKVK